MIEVENSRKFNFILDNLDSIEKINNLLGMMNASFTQNIRFILSTRCISYLTDKYDSYILNLVDVITLNKNDIVLKIDGITNTVSKEVTDITITRANIIYPSLKKNIINVFDLEDYVKTKVRELIIFQMNNTLIENQGKIENKQDFSDISKYKLNIAEICKYKI